MSDAEVERTPRGWTGQRRGGRLGNGFFVLLLRLGGLPLAPFFVGWVALWFVCAVPAARRASLALARRLGVGGGPLGRLFFAWRHFLGFGLVQVDRMAVLAGQGGRYRFHSRGLRAIREALAEGRGAVLVTAHLGNWEIMGQLLADIGAPVALVMYQATDAAGSAALDALERERGFRVIRADGSPATAAAILAALRDGCCVGIMGDRMLGGAGARVQLLGAPVTLPVAPYLVAARAGAPLFHTFCVRAGLRRYEFLVYPAEPAELGVRAERDAALQRAAAAFAQRLEQRLAAHPEQWGNFHDLWAEESA